MRYVIFAVTFLVAGCGSEEPTPPSLAPVEDVADAGSSVFGQIEDAQSLTRLTDLIEVAGLTSVLADTSTAYTVFAPSNDAFESSGIDLEVDSLRAREIVLSHVLSTRMLTFDVFPDLSIETLGGSEISFAEAGEGLSVIGPGGTGRIIESDLDTDNGVVHVIDTVISPR
ncbi:fasciclin domain-containing protein [Rubrivirga sp.]|uniref:fasciclin domain-containing protein n=1 Tax=Rubrivirga sp. TaxID=1885344 RepID=UPI003C780495